MAKYLPNADEATHLYTIAAGSPDSFAVIRASDLFYAHVRTPESVMAAIAIMEDQRG